MSKNFKPLSLTLSLGALVGSMAIASAANASPLFGVVSLGSAGYMAVGEGKCGEGKCGMDKMDANKDGMVSKAEHAAAADAMFNMADANKDGMVSKDEMAKAKEAEAGADKMKEGHCGAGMKAHEGSCGGEKGKEGKCGGAA